MALRWNAEQVAIYNFIQGGAKNKDLKSQGYKLPLIKKIKSAMSKGDTPNAPQKAHEPKTPPGGAPLFTATLKTKPMTLEPMVAVRYDSVRHALGLGDDYTLEQFLDEATDIVTELVGAVPPGFTKEQAEETKEVAVV